MTNGSRTWRLTSLGLILLAAAIAWQLLAIYTPNPVLVIEITSPVESRAQIYYDIGHGFYERDSQSLPIHASPLRQRLTFPLPRRPIQQLRFDPTLGESI